MKRVEGVEDLNSRIICAQGIVGVGAIIRTCIASSPVAVCRQTAATGSPAGPTSFCLSACLRLTSAGWFLAALEKAFDAKKLTFYGSLAPLRDGRAFRRYLAPARKAECRVGEDVATLTPHRPGRADFPHPVLHERGSLTAAYPWRILTEGSGWRARSALKRAHGTTPPRCRRDNDSKADL